MLSLQRKYKFKWHTKNIISIYTIAISIYFAFIGNAFADSWPPPESFIVSSSNGMIQVKVDPGNSYGDQFGFMGSPKGKWANATWMRKYGGIYLPFKTIALQNPVAPMQAFVTNEGDLFTLDNHHNIGFGSIIVLYNPAGKIIREATLTDIYNAKQIDSMSHSTSSVHWRCFNDVKLMDKKLWIRDTIGGEIEIDSKSGEIFRIKSEDKCSH